MAQNNKDKTWPWPKMDEALAKETLDKKEMRRIADALERIAIALERRNWYQPVVPNPNPYQSTPGPYWNPNTTYCGGVAQCKG